MPKKKPEPEPEPEPKKKSKPKEIPPDYTLIVGLKKTNLKANSIRLYEVSKERARLEKEEKALKAENAAIFLKTAGPSLKSVSIDGQYRATRTEGESEQASVKKLRALFVEQGWDTDKLEACISKTPWTSFKVSAIGGDDDEDDE